MACSHRLGTAVKLGKGRSLCLGNSVLFGTHQELCSTPENYGSVCESMADNLPRADGGRVLADLNALRAIGAYKTGVHKPTFSEPHLRSLQWLVHRLPEAGLAGEIDGIGNVVGSSTKPGPKLLAGSH